MSKLLRYMIKNRLEAGIDEVARGCLAGPVVAAAVIWNPDLEKTLGVKIPDIKDSKKLKPSVREEYSSFIKFYAIDYHISFVSEKDIDEMNIRKATFKAMHQAINGLTVEPEHLLIDGNSFESYISDTFNSDIKYSTVVKGDNKYLSIACASILAKVARDDYIIDLVNNNPELEKYGWRKNNAYGTKDHINAIKKYGITEHHRKTFGICKEYANT
jgi:ribonuclease HII